MTVTRVAAEHVLPNVVVDRRNATPLARQIYDRIARAILEGRLASGSRLPSSRTLAAQLDVSRNTVNAAYEQLTAEGYIESAVGSGTRVTASLPEDVRPRGVQFRAGSTSGALPAVSKRGASLTALLTTPSSYDAWSRPFSHGAAAFDLFPTKLWMRLLSEELERLPRAILGYGDPRGYRPLREAIARDLGRTRGVYTSAEHVIIVSGSQQALDLAARVLLDPGDGVLVEDPGYLGARAALLAAGARLRPISVDEEGLRIDTLRTAHRGARAAYVTPSHQFPLGSTLSLTRRLALLEWAQSSNAWIFEDDYDGEYRYGGKPLAALASLDADGRVIYMGTFSKVMFPALRLGFMVVPEAIAERVAAARAIADRHSPSLEQAALAAFITQGHYARHVRRMRSIYGERRATLVELLRAGLGNAAEVEAPKTGMYVIVWLPPGADDRTVANELAREEILATPVSAYRLRTSGRGGLLLGFANADPQPMRAAAARFCRVLVRGDRHFRQR